MMGLIGIILAMLVNFFLHSSSLEYIISILGVLIFTGLTAYDVQRLKKIGAGAGAYGEENARKFSILGATYALSGFHQPVFIPSQVSGKQKVNNMTAYVFPGQGAQFTGMGKDLYDKSDSARMLFEKANDIRDSGLPTLCLPGQMRI